ncbi:VWA domain-containing protein, partial [Streptomyces albidus (ex Kaewkla and Franco 2022)]|uniref:VWA domain-containing protein n=1 Tax=Streptomyces albidus (ex Kaewkla and Franco 2022) TaxID=722709 RepID=UPI0028155AED
MQGVQRLRARGAAGWRTAAQSVRRKATGTTALHIGALTIVLVLAFTVLPGFVAWSRPGDPGPTVTPDRVDESLSPGDSLTVDKKVRTPVVPPRPDVVLLVDGTGSMGPPIADVQENLRKITDSVTDEQSDARFAVATYGDTIDGPRAYTVLQGLTDNMDDVQKNGVDRLDTDRGAYSPGPAEDWLNALWQIAHGSGGQTEFREGASPVVVLVGDASSHDPSLGHSLGDTTSALRNAGVRVLGVDVTTDLGDGLNGNGDNGNGDDQNQEPTHEPGQATKVVEETNGELFEGIDADKVSDKVVEGLTNLPTTISYQTLDCDPSLDVSLEPATQTVTSGSTAEFTETIEAAEDAPQGTELTCRIQFLADGKLPDGSAPDTIVDDAATRQNRDPYAVALDRADAGRGSGGR